MMQSKNHMTLDHISFFRVSFLLKGTSLFCVGSCLRPGEAPWKVARLMEKPLAFPQVLGKPGGNAFQGGPGFPHLPPDLLRARAKEG